MKRKPFIALLPAGCLLLVGLAVYWPFLFGNAVLLYKDIGSDSLISYYPDFVHLSHYIRSHGLPSWSFYVAMGQDLAYAIGYLIWQPVSWLPGHLIASALVFQHLAKVIVAGFFFFRFLQLRDLSPPVPLLGSLLLSFSAYMSMGSCWYPLADEVICFAGVLWATELALQRGCWLMLVLTVALVGMINPFFLYLCALFLSCYLPLRLFDQHGWQPRLILRTCIPLISVSALGVGLGAIITLPYFHAVLNSPRGSGTTSAVATLSSFPIFGLESPLHYITAIFRSFANDMLGTGDDFRGWLNYLEAPLTYCGLICLLLLPQAFIGASSRRRIIYLLCLAAIFIPTIFPWFRYFFWLFQGDYYRTYSLFCILGIITLSVIAFSRYLERRVLNLWLLGATTLVLVGILYLLPGQLPAPVNSDLRFAATILLLLFALLLAIGRVTKRQTLAAYLVLALAAVELVQFNRITVSNRKTVTKQELSERVGYNDETVNAVRDIKATDGSFFRITKVRPSAPSVYTSLNDAMVFGYYGTSSYSSFNNVNYTNFLTAVGAMSANSETDTRWAMGLGGYSTLSLFAGEKYLLVTNPVPFQTTTQYQLIGQYGQDYLFRNEFFLPLGLTFDRFVPEEEFAQLPRETRSEALLGVAVLPKTSGMEHGILPMTASELEAAMKATSLSEVIAQRRKTGLHLTSFRQSRIEGTVHLDQKSILIVQTPFDRGWRALQDGEPAPVVKADMGLLGIPLNAGEHKLELYYRNPFLLPAMAISLASLLILALALWRWPRLAPSQPEPQTARRLA